MYLGNKKIFKNSFGLSLVEVVIAASIFSIVAMSVYQGFFSLNRLISLSREKVTMTDLINEQFEIARNLPFSSVGILQGIPDGVLSATSTAVRDGRTFLITRTIRNVDDPFDGTIGGSPNDLSPADYKMFEILVTCVSCKSPQEMSATGHIAPKNLETASTNGALFIRVFDANGNPVPQARVQVTNTSQGIYIDEVTNNSGALDIVDAIPGANAYNIIVSKTGYTQDRTYASSVSNPNPVNLDSTVLLQQVTQNSFVIDHTSSLNIRTINSFCEPIANVPINISGTKLIGTNPNVFKWSYTGSTDSSGSRALSNIEWDSLTFSLGGGFYSAGTNPIGAVSILPESEQSIDISVSEQSPNILLVKVKDAATSLPISGATVSLSGVSTEETDKGFLRQTDWSGGAGQTNFTDTTRFHTQDGNIEINDPAGEIKLVNSLGNYVLGGELTSSIFDTGTSSNWSRVDIEPADQPLESGANSVRFQIATAPENTVTTTWDFKGPDGTGATFYTILDNNINPIHNGDRYIRYKIFLSTEDQSHTPNVSDFIISFSSSCIPPGQVSFGSLSNGNYSLDVSATGFVSQNIPVDINSSWQELDVLLSPL